MNSLFEACHFCQELATTERAVPGTNQYHEASVEVVPVCQWHDEFHQWVQDTLGQLVRERLALRES